VEKAVDDVEEDFASVKTTEEVGDLRAANKEFPIPQLCPPPPPAMFQNIKRPGTDREALTNMLMSWYMSGYHTGYYQGLSDGKSAKSAEKDAQ
jgi:hypothetical protein